LQGELVVDSIFLIILVLFSMAGSLFKLGAFKSLHEVVAGKNTRVQFYLSGMVLGCFFALIPAVCLRITHRSNADIGLQLPTFFADGINQVFAIVTVISAAVLLALALFQIITSLCSATQRAEVDAQIRERIKTARTKDEISRYLIMPVTITEKKVFVFFALTAGVCEELSLRGLLFCLLFSLFPALPPYLVLVISSAFFGLLHMHQGLPGAIRAGLIGIVLGALYLATGSLIPSILLHFTINLSNAFMLDSNNPDMLNIPDDERLDHHQSP
jgi:membrane protease YdiL (CAAX protease family)